MSYKLPALPYSYDALAPIIDAKTMEIHYTKHHAGYVDALNKALEPYPDYASLPIEDLIQQYAQLPQGLKKSVRNFGGGHSNHLLFWNMMTPDPSKRTFPDHFLIHIDETFGSLESFKNAFFDNAIKQFGSGWSWLVLDTITQKMLLVATPNQDSPYLENHIPLLGIDVWEHAYYLTYQNRRAEYVKAWFSLVNWHYVAQQYKIMIQ